MQFWHNDVGPQAQWGGAAGELTPQVLAGDSETCFGAAMKYSVRQAAMNQRSIASLAPASSGASATSWIGGSPL